MRVICLFLGALIVASSLYGCAVKSEVKKEAKPVSRPVSVQLPVQIQSNARITIIPVMLKENPAENPVSPIVIDQCIMNLAGQIKAKMADNYYQVSLLSYPVDIGNLALEMMHLSETADYYTLVYVTFLENNISDAGTAEIKDTPGKSPLTKKFIVKSQIKTRIEFYDARNYLLLWQTESSSENSMTTGQNISGTKELDDLLISLITPNYYKKINDETVNNIAREMFDRIHNFTAVINPDSLVKLNLYLYLHKPSYTNLVKHEKVTMTNLISGHEEELETDASGRIKTTLPEGFYLVEAETHNPSGKLSGNSKIQTLITGESRRLNLILK